jgi:preprotein translocase subunit SecY
MLFFRVKSRTLTGEVFKRSDLAYGRLAKQAKTRNLSIIMAVLMAAFVNLVYSLSLLVRVYVGETYLAILLLMPSTILLLFLGIFLWASNKYEKNTYRANHDKK